jgi:hypothetical protein
MCSLNESDQWNREWWMKRLKNMMKYCIWVDGTKLGGNCPFGQFALKLTKTDQIIEGG